MRVMPNLSKKHFWSEGVEGSRERVGSEGPKRSRVGFDAEAINCKKCGCAGACRLTVKCDRLQLQREPMQFRRAEFINNGNLVCESNTNEGSPCTHISDTSSGCLVHDERRWEGGWRMGAGAHEQREGRFTLPILIPNGDWSSDIGHDQNTKWRHCHINHKTYRKAPKTIQSPRKPIQRHQILDKNRKC